MTIMYIHGYGSDGNALKGRLLRELLPECEVISPTFDYDHTSPWQVQQQLRSYVEQHQVRMLVGSSFGGYHALCAAAFFRGPIWAVNPVRDVEATIRRIAPAGQAPATTEHFVALYSDFDRQTFRPLVRQNQTGLWPDATPLYFALSLDDALLGDHQPLLTLFPHHAVAIWKDHCGHHFLRFDELEQPLRDALP